MSLEILTAGAIGLGCGALIGVERQWRGHEAGLHTNALVALGAAVFVASAQALSGSDAAGRMAAQVATGVGFLGAGLIWRKGGLVQGLNTAATVWCAAACGIAAGFGDPRTALMLAAMITAANAALHYADRALMRRHMQKGGPEDPPSTQR